jgi:hypothetical protein
MEVSRIENEEGESRDPPLFKKVQRRGIIAPRLRWGLNVYPIQPPNHPKEKLTGSYCASRLLPNACMQRFSRRLVIVIICRWCCRRAFAVATFSFESFKFQSCFLNTDHRSSSPSRTLHRNNKNNNHRHWHFYLASHPCQKKN